MGLLIVSVLAIGVVTSFALVGMNSDLRQRASELYPVGSSCTSSSECASGVCRECRTNEACPDFGGKYCFAPDPTRVVVQPSNTPAPSCISEGSACWPGAQCCSGLGYESSVCKKITAATSVPSSTPVVTAQPACITSGNWCGPGAVAVGCCVGLTCTNTTCQVVSCSASCVNGCTTINGQSACAPYCKSSCLEGCVTQSSTGGVCKNYCNKSCGKDEKCIKSSTGGSCISVASCLGLDNSECAGRNDCEWAGFCKPKPTPSPPEIATFESYISVGEYCGPRSSGHCTPGTVCNPTTLVCEGNGAVCIRRDNGTIMNAGDKYQDSFGVCRYCDGSGQLVIDPSACANRPDYVHCYIPDFSTRTCTATTLSDSGIGDGCPVSSYTDPTDCQNVVNSQLVASVNCKAGQRFCFGPSTSVFCTADVTVTATSNRSEVIFQSCPFRCSPQRGGACISYPNTSGCANHNTWCSDDGNSQVRNGIRTPMRMGKIHGCQKEQEKLTLENGIRLH